MDRYTHTAFGSQVDAVENLPSTLPTSEAGQATGTDGKNLACHLASQDGKTQNTRDKCRLDQGSLRKGGTSRKTAKTHTEPAIHAGKELEAAIGFEPMINGFANRRL